MGAYGGRRDVMQVVAPLGPAYQAGTLSGNPLATAAGIACLKELARPGVYETLEALGAEAEASLSRVGSATGVSLTVNRVGSMLTAFFTEPPVATWSEATSADVDLYASFFHGLLERGVYVALVPVRGSVRLAGPTLRLIWRSPQSRHGKPWRRCSTVEGRQQTPRARGAMRNQLRRMSRWLYCLNVVESRPILP